MNDPLDSLRSEGDLNISPRRASWALSSIDRDTQAILDEDARYFLHQSLSTPCLNAIVECDGIYLIDAQGHRIMDFHGNNVHQVGYRNQRVMDAVREQLETLPFCPRRYTNAPAIALAKKLAQLAPGDLNKVLFAPGGTSAIGIALKLARAATGRFKTISMWESFHGASLDAISLGGEAIFRRGAGPLLPGAEHVPPPDPTHCPFGCGATCTLRCADYIEYVLEKEGDVAAVIAETVRSAPFVPPREYWQRVRAACDRHGALLILDEIPTCLGRTGRMFACEHYDVVPDILVIGKGLGGGVMPIAAVIARDKLNVAGDRALGHYTHEKNPVACVAGLATLEFIEAAGLLRRTLELGAYALERMRALKECHRIVGDVRGIGLMLGMELVRDGDRTSPATSEAEDVMYRALSRGLSFKITMGNILTLTPPLTISREELDRAFDILDACLRDTARG
ncbi:MAG: aspartate aminotransferase family protein [Candidatus Hydrogenedentes bacterium]|nr:aspartate aminotransferase family protein [Candidatus Hydrogenedentota bacterium]